MNELKAKIVNLMGRPFTTLPVAADLPRLAGVVTVKVQEEVTVEGKGHTKKFKGKTAKRSSLLMRLGGGSSGDHAVAFPPGNLEERVEHAPTPGIENQNTNLSRLLVALAGHLEPYQKRDIESSFSRYFYDKHAGKQIENKASFFSEEIRKGILGYLKDEFGGDSSRVVYVLKAFNQAVISPAITMLKLAIGVQYMTKDVKDSWFIKVRLPYHKIPESPTAPVVVRVSTEKREQHIHNMFQYQWRLDIDLEFGAVGEMSVQDVRLSITDLMFHEYVHSQCPENKIALKKVLDTMLEAGVYERSHTRIWEFYRGAEPSAGSSGTANDEESTSRSDRAADRDSTPKRDKKTLGGSSHVTSFSARQESFGDASPPSLRSRSVGKKDGKILSRSRSIAVEDDKKHAPLSPAVRGFSHEAISFVFPEDQTLSSSPPFRSSARKREKQGKQKKKGGSAVGQPVRIKDVATAVTQSTPNMSRKFTYPNARYTATLTYANGDWYKGGMLGPYRDGDGSYGTPKGDVYTGEYRNDRRQGWGTYTMQDGTRYEGEFSHGKPHGQGTYVWPNGDVYTGSFSNDEFQGFGSWSSSTGERYEGEFKRGMRHGRGASVSLTGAKYEGEFRKNVKDGYGKYMFQTGERYEGDFADNKFSGHGTYYHHTGQVVSGMFQDGELVEIIMVCEPDSPRSTTPTISSNTTSNGANTTTATATAATTTTSGANNEDDTTDRPSFNTATPSVTFATTTSFSSPNNSRRK
eukprot:TRINITY_DN5332_c0_g1_i3.p1 TRINITY_DN5332_c0_g1~~TRINITY_DN5332_c0_g1_i3.p1  ORF type:complete len:747 (-),score=122.63 TRINITY_DN5332_c0_g1_i3:151-2391(-)